MTSNRRYSNPINEHTAKVLAEIREITAVLHEKFDEQKGDLHVLEQAVEMNLWVQLKVLHEGVEPGGDPEDLVKKVRLLQREYLATVAISNFLREARALEVSSE